MFKNKWEQIKSAKSKQEEQKQCLYIRQLTTCSRRRDAPHGTERLKNHCSTATNTPLVVFSTKMLTSEAPPPPPCVRPPPRLLLPDATKERREPPPPHRRRQELPRLTLLLGNTFRFLRSGASLGFPVQTYKSQSPPLAQLSPTDNTTRPNRSTRDSHKQKHPRERFSSSVWKNKIIIIIIIDRSCLIVGVSLHYPPSVSSQRGSVWLKRSSDAEVLAQRGTSILHKLPLISWGRTP